MAHNSIQSKSTKEVLFYSVCKNYVISIIYHLSVDRDRIYPKKTYICVSIGRERNTGNNR